MLARRPLLVGNKEDRQGTTMLILQVNKSYMA